MNHLSIRSNFGMKKSNMCKLLKITSIFPNSKTVKLVCKSVITLTLP